MMKIGKIAIAIPSLAMGGAERVASELANEFVRNGIDVKFILLDKNEVYYKLDENVKVYYNDYDKTKNSFFRNRERVKSLKKWLKDNSIDILISFLTSSNFLSILATRNMDIKVYISERSDPNKTSKKAKLIRKLLYNYCTGAIFQTEDAKKCFSKTVQKKSIVIGNPIKRNLPKWSSVENHNKSIVTAIRLEKSKNIPMLLDAFSELLQKHPDYQLIIFGDGPEYNNIKAKMQELNIESNVILKGKSSTWHEDAIYSTMFVLSSEYEGMSNSLLEALAMGIPSISTDHPIGGAREVIQNGENGFLVPVNDKQALANKMMELIENQELQVHFSRRAEEIEKDLNVQAIAKKWLEFLESED